MQLIHIKNFVCPFCPLSCDDLIVERHGSRVALLRPSCEQARIGFAHASFGEEEIRPAPAVDGRPAPLEEAEARAANLLAGARLPLIGGLSTDVDGIRAALRLAERCGALVDHANAAAMQRNLTVMQSRGWVTTSLSETRNRADLIVICGASLFDRYPRLVERVLQPASRLLAGCEPQLLLLGPWREQALPGALDGWRPKVVNTAMRDMAELFGLLRAELRGRANQLTGTTDGERVTSDLADLIKKAAYPVIVWSASDFDFPHADLAIENMVGVVRDLNETGRCAALPLAAGQSDVSALQVCAWSTGFPPRLSFAEGQPHYDPYLFDAQRVLDAGEADTLLWISTFAPNPRAPSTEIPSIVLGHPRMAPSTDTTVFIPVAVPGVDHPGTLFRSDGVALSLRSTERELWPSAAQVLERILARLA